MLGIAAIAGVFAQQNIQAANQEVETARAEAKKTQEDADAKTQQAEVDVKNAQLNVNTAVQKQKQAEKNEQQAQQNVKSAEAKQQQEQRKAQQAAEQLASAKANLQQVDQEANQKIQAANQDLNAAREAAKKAEVDARQAQENRRQAEAAYKDAQVALDQAKAETSIAQQGTKFEQDGATALRQYEGISTRSGFGEIDALLTAMRAGQGLQKLVDESPQSKIKELKDYPAFSPIFALQQILYGIRERNQFKGHQGFVYSVSFSPDGQQLATASSDGTARLWPVITDLKELLTLGCDWLSDYLVAHPKDLEVLAICQNQSNRLAAVPFLIREGEVEARSGKVEAAIASFRIALKWKPDLNFNPEKKAKNLAEAASLVRQGESLARQGKLEEATAQFQRALQLDPSLDFNPQTKARQVAAASLVSQGESLATDGKLEEATAQFQRALQLDPSLDFNPQTKARQVAAASLVSQGESLANEGKIEDAISAYAKAQTLDPTIQISADSWSTLCWNGALREQATAVMDACEKAVELAPGIAGIRESRGLARALTGNFAGAIEDFEVAIPSIDDNVRRARRQRWVEALRAGRNPFTPEVIDKLLKDSSY